MTKKSLRPKHAANLLGISIATFWRYKRSDANFPSPRHLSNRCTVFDCDELLAWRDAKRPASNDRAYQEMTTA